MTQGSRRIWFIVAAWATTIFITSCTFIERRVFIDFVGRFIPTGVPKQIWVSFWGAFGIVVVKAYHMAEFALLCYLLFLLINARWAKKQSVVVLTAAAISALYAVSDEWHQTFVPGRGGTWVDVVIDCCGIGLSSAAVMWQIKRRRQCQHGRPI
jgi:hypothetical protein